jgi:hypothetical protein
MRTSLNDIRLIDNFLSGKLSPEKSLLFHVRLIEDPVLRINLCIQQKVYTLLRTYHRKKLKEEIESFHEKIFSDPLKADLQERILYHFKHKAL